MKTPQAPRISPFDAIKQLDEAGNEYWSARDLGKLLTYKSWQKFEQVIADAIQACERSQQMPADHFIRSDKVIRRAAAGVATRSPTTTSRATPATSSFRTPTLQRRSSPSVRPTLPSRPAARSSAS
jgi:hypothetical protein